MSPVQHVQAPVKLRKTFEAASTAESFPPNSSLKVLYVFSGLPRQADIRSRLELLQSLFLFALQIVEFDLLLDQSHDVSAPQTWKHLCSLLESGTFDVLIISPPCNTFSRARHSYRTSPGPKPLRNFHWPSGFPWLEGQSASDVSLANLLIDRSIQSCQKAFNSGTLFVLEHPEDLGKTSDDELPASIWQLDAIRQLQLNTQAHTWALFQCTYGEDFGLQCAESSKPTRLLSTLSCAAQEPFLGWPIFDSDRQYRGPLPAHCKHNKHVPLIGRSDNGKFKTAPLAAYPPAQVSFYHCPFCLTKTAKEGA
jgi:hypothetical protein